MINQMISLSSSRPIRFAGLGSLANQVSRDGDFSQSGLAALQIQSIRFREAESSANQVFEEWEFTQSGI